MWGGGEPGANTSHGDQHDTLPPPVILLGDIPPVPEIPLIWSTSEDAPFYEWPPNIEEIYKQTGEPSTLCMYNTMVLVHHNGRLKMRAFYSGRKNAVNGIGPSTDIPFCHVDRQHTRGSSYFSIILLYHVMYEEDYLNMASNKKYAEGLVLYGCDFSCRSANCTKSSLSLDLGVSGQWQENTITTWRNVIPATFFKLFRGCCYQKRGSACRTSPIDFLHGVRVKTHFQWLDWSPGAAHATADRWSFKISWVDLSAMWYPGSPSRPHQRHNAPHVSIGRTPPINSPPRASPPPPVHTTRAMWTSYTRASTFKLCWYPIGDRGNKHTPSVQVYRYVL